MAMAGAEENQQMHLLDDDDEGQFIKGLRNSMSWLPTIPVGSLSDRYYRNFLWFTLLFCIVHASVDAVLAFSTAELGMGLGSNGSFCLYIFYTFSAFFLAKPWLARYGPKHTVGAGLLGMLVYVLSFFLAVAVDPMSSARSTIWLLGASLGGVGAGLLWIGQGSYYTTNSREYALALQRENLSTDSTSEGRNRLSALGLDATSSATLATFASVFAFGYLLLETVFKMAATGVYLADNKDGEDSRGWKRAIFGVFTVAALVALVFFALYVINFKANGRTSIDTRIDSAGGGSVELQDRSKHSLGSADMDLHGGGGGSSKGSMESVDLSGGAGAGAGGGGLHTDLWETIKKQSTDVAYAMYNSSKLRYLIPYQIMFGFISGFLNAYINARYVAVYLGDGYIGILSALITITAAAVSYPYARLSIKYEHGVYYVMLLGAGAFFYSGLSVWIASDAAVGTWGFLVPYFCVYGLGRGAWESTNKVVLAAYFKDDNNMKDAGFAAIYFTSGLAAAIAYVSFRHLSKDQLVAINTFMPAIAALCFHLSYDQYMHELLMKRLAAAEKAEREAAENAEERQAALNAAAGNGV